MEIRFTSRPYLPILIISILLFISIFLPWIKIDFGSYSYFGHTMTGYSGSGNGTESGWGIITLIVGLIGAGLSFVLPEKMRSLFTIFAGMLGFVGVIAYWFAVHGTIVSLSWGDYLSPNFGIFIAGFLTIIMIFAGFVSNRKSDVSVTSTNPLGPTDVPPPPPRSSPTRKAVKSIGGNKKKPITRKIRRKSYSNDDEKVLL